MRQDNARSDHLCAELPDLGWQLLDLGRQWAAWGYSQEDPDYGHFSFEDPVPRDSARADPQGFVTDLPERVILDEVQRVPKLFEAIKISVDCQRTPGRFLLTGSTNVFLVPRLSESLAGRLQNVPLHPLTQ